jgi:hypothetical protein
MRRPALALAVLAAAGCGAPGMAPGEAPQPLASAAHARSAAPDWYHDVQPIVQSRCIGCHTAGGIAPFPLTSYEDAFFQNQTIAAAVQTRRMPPWMPAEACLPLRDARRLEPAEIDTIVSWSIAGAPAGDPGETPPPIAPPAGLGSVDARLDPGIDYVPHPDPAAHPHDDYHCFALDPGLTEDRDVVGIEVLPGQPSLVHHVLLFAVPPAAAAAADDAEPGPGWTCFGGPGVTAIPAIVGGWAPGSGPTRAPEGTGIPVAAGSALVMQVHYNLDHAAPIADRTIVQLQYASGRVSRPARVLPLADLGFAIPPGASGYRTSVGVTFPQPATLWGLAPHMHTLGRHIRVEKDGACLIDIPAWDFHWQQAYFLKDPLAIAAGSRVTLTCTWDNPTARTVMWGEGTSDEMCLSYLYLTF